jgi:hypothetical protein
MPGRPRILWLGCLMIGRMRRRGWIFGMSCGRLSGRAGGGLMGSDATADELPWWLAVIQQLQEENNLLREQLAVLVWENT